MNKIEKERRNEIRRDLKVQARNNLLKKLPIPLQKLQDCFEFIDKNLKVSDCDDTFTITNQFIVQNNLPKIELLSWFKENGGYCDCEILANVESEINDK